MTKPSEKKKSDKNCAQSRQLTGDGKGCPIALLGVPRAVSLKTACVNTVYRSVSP